METLRGIAENAVETLGITGSIRSILIKDTDSPWNEKALIKRKAGLLDVKISVWPGKPFLFGRVFRLFLYLYDVLDPEFRYDPSLAPREDEQEVTARYNQIWSLFVDSRMEKRGIENFFDRRMRRNLFIDMEKGLSWEDGKTLFDTLWAKSSFTYGEIIDLSRKFHTIRESEPLPRPAPQEVEMAERIGSPHVREHIERTPSAAFREMVNDILSFAAYHCKDCHIGSSYYGISLIYQRRVFAELIPTWEDLLYFTFLNTDSDAYETELVTSTTETERVQEKIKAIYQAVSAHSHNL